MTNTSYRVYMVNKNLNTKSPDAIFSNAAQAEQYAVEQLSRCREFVTHAEIYTFPSLSFVMTVKRN